MTSASLKHVAIAGNIGAGKTTLVRKLASHYGWEAHLEAVDNNPYLKDFYEDMATWAFPLQIYFLHSRFNQVRSIRQGSAPVIQDRTIYEDAYIFARNLRKSGLLSERDHQNYLTLFECMIEMLEAPDLLIYLKASLSKLQKQIQRRGRDFELDINPQYLIDLNEHYEDWIGGYQEGKLIVIEVDELDYVQRPEDLEYIIQQIDSAVQSSQPTY
ncbi:MAG: deoxynucleoside kinase [Bacteroidota bacterium]